MKESETSSRRGAAVAIVVAANAVMAISQSNIASIYLPVSLDFHQSLYGLGLLTSVYFVGYGLFEIPGSILGAKIGPKRMVTAGGTLTAFALAACALSPTFQLLTVFRAVAGVGYGLLFPPCLVITIRNLGSRAAGLGAALAMVSFSVGGTAGILGWSLLSTFAGWRASLLVEFLITVGIIIAVALIVPSEASAPGFGVKLSHLKAAATNKATLALALSVFGGGAAANLTGSFLVYYLEKALGLSPPVAGLLGSATYLAPVFTGLLAGRFYDRGASVKKLLALGAVMVTSGTAMVAYPSVYTALIGSVLAGLALGTGGTATFSLARDLAKMPEYESLNVSLVDAASLLGLFASPLYFSAIAASLGYSTAWFLGSLTATVFVVPILLVRIEPLGPNRKAADSGRATVGKN